MGGNAKHEKALEDLVLRFHVAAQSGKVLGEEGRQKLDRERLEAERMKGVMAMTATAISPYGHEGEVSRC